jgi:hypothetical protein
MGKHDFELGTLTVYRILMQIDVTGQKNTVLTLYELSQGDLAMTEGSTPNCSFSDLRISRNGSCVVEEGITNYGEKRCCNDI